MTFQLSNELKDAVEHARQAVATPLSAQMALRSLDLTSLKGNESPNQIRQLLKAAEMNGLASLCIAPRLVKVATSMRRPNSAVRIATVVNFPDGAHSGFFNTERATPRSTTMDMCNNNANGATQNDIVLDYDGFQRAMRAKDENELNRIGDLLLAAKGNAGRSSLKVIIGTAAFDDPVLLREACEFAAGFGTDCLKSDTGFHPNGGVTLERAAIMMDVAKKHGMGVKISAGVKNEHHAAQYQALAEAIYGMNIARNPNIFRIGASSALPHLLSAAQGHVTPVAQVETAEPQQQQTPPTPDNDY